MSKSMDYGEGFGYVFSGLACMGWSWSFALMGERIGLKTG